MDLESKQLIKTTIKDETKIVMEYLGAVLKEAGLTYDNIVKQPFSYQT
jgi:enamine deaminase RidA (YjgF/YER057c/UK114 family)